MLITTFNVINKVPDIKYTLFRYEKNFHVAIKESYTSTTFNVISKIICI